MVIRLIDVDVEHVGQRIDNFLFTNLKGVPKSHIYKVLRSGEVRVNKGRKKPHYRLCQGDSVRIPPIRVAPPQPTNLSFTKTMAIDRHIIFEDSKLIVINKPSGMAVHGGSGIIMGVIEALRLLRPQAPYLELVHRLDRETSGCLMIAKKRSMLRYLHELLRESRIDKRYYALVYGHWQKHKTKINAPLQKNQLRGGERIVTVHPDGKPAKTCFKVFEHFTNCSFVEAMPVTGRTHQIRVHAAHAGHAIVGDCKYSDTLASELLPFSLKRLFLHAHTLAFKHPENNKNVVFTAPLEQQLEHLLNQLRTSQAV